MATTVQCSDGHTNQGTRSLCGVCGKQLPFPAEWQKEGPRFSRMSKAALIAGAVMLMAVVIAYRIGSESGGGRQSADVQSVRPGVNQPETYPPQIPPSNSEDWYRAVCRPGTIVPGGGGLRSASLRDACLSDGGPIWIGHYNSALMKDNDLARFQGRVHYAEIVDDAGNVWLFVVPVPGRTTALEPLRQFGFIVARPR